MLNRDKSCHKTKQEYFGQARFCSKSTRVCKHFKKVIQNKQIWINITIQVYGIFCTLYTMTPFFKLT